MPLIWPSLEILVSSPFHCSFYCPHYDKTHLSQDSVAQCTLFRVPLITASRLMRREEQGIPFYLGFNYDPIYEGMIINYSNKTRSYGLGIPLLLRPMRVCTCVTKQVRSIQDQMVPLRSVLIRELSSGKIYPMYDLTDVHKSYRENLRYVNVACQIRVDLPNIIPRSSYEERGAIEYTLCGYKCNYIEMIKSERGNLSIQRRCKLFHNRGLVHSYEERKSLRCLLCMRESVVFE